ncbi:unnamed protein product [Triticum turgidum subsp. durum]|uniref:Uncharacterized protein n=1 Tax=Triticum turgidum subsp. durum TaxID=4567 RepID=A0A9R1S573_TRITD|nr:unnamed protein product [Triticum turgidum subsp. durum]
MVDKPSRALVLYAAGHAALLAGGGGGKVQLDAFASIASCGFLSVRTPARTAGPRPQGSYIQPATGDLLAGEYVQQPEEAPVGRGSRRILQRSAVEY